MLTPDNVDEFKKVKWFAKKNKLYLGYRLVDSGELYNRKECAINYDLQKSKIFAELKKCRENIFKANLLGWFMKKEKPLECYALFSTIFLDPQGNISTCIRKGKVAGLPGKNPVRVWAGLSKERDKIKDCRKCYTDCQLIPDLIMTGTEKVR
jgi:hypothetical protein